MKVLVQNNDIKTKMYSSNGKKNKIDIIGLEGNEIFYPIKLMKHLFILKPDIFVFRYLNDSKSIIKTILRFNSELLILLILKIFRIDLYWVLHNVDRETHSHFPKLTKIRRQLIANNSKKIFVTNEMLVPYAQKILKENSSKVDYLSFGYLDKPVETMNAYTKKILDFIEIARKDNDSVIGICIGNANYKTEHFVQLDKFLQASEKNNINMYLVIGGDISKYYRTIGLDVFEKVKKSKKVLIIDEKFNFQDQYVVPKIDFYWRVYKDMSTPYTTFQASHYNKPIISLNQGFLSILIKEYRLGYLLCDNYQNMVEVFDQLRNFNKESCNEFLSSNNWNTFFEKNITNCRNEREREK